MAKSEPWAVWGRLTRPSPKALKEDSATPVLCCPSRRWGFWEQRQQAGEGFEEKGIQSL